MKKATTNDNKNVKSKSNQERKKPALKTELDVDVTLEEMFHEIDRDNSGAISFDEFRKFMSESGMQETAMSDKEIEDMIGNADKNKDKKIKFNEFVKIMTSM